MSAAEQVSMLNPEIAGHSLKEGVEWCEKHWPRLRLGHEGVMLESMQRGLRIREVLARNEMTGKRDNLDGWPGEEDDDKVGVDIGDHIHYHLPQPQPEARPQPEPVAPAPGPGEQSAWSKWLPVLAAAALGSGGTGLGMLAMNYFGADQQQPQQAAPVDALKDFYGIKLEHYVPGGGQ